MSPRRPCRGRLLHTEGEVVSAGPWGCSIHLDRLCRTVFQPIKPGFSAQFRHSSSLACVCLYSARGGEGICEIIEIPTSWFMYSIGFGADRDLPDGDLFSMCVRFCFGPHLGGVLAV